MQIVCRTRRARRGEGPNAERGARSACPNSGAPHRQRHQTPMPCVHKYPISRPQVLPSSGPLTPMQLSLLQCHSTTCPRRCTLICCDGMLPNHPSAEHGIFPCDTLHPPTTLPLNTYSSTMYERNATPSPMQQTLTVPVSLFSLGISSAHLLRRIVVAFNRTQGTWESPLNRPSRANWL